MATTLVKRMDSARMRRMYDMALETSDADFLSSTTDITIDHVRSLQLDNNAKEKISSKSQKRPPQPPKPKPQSIFSLNSFDFLLDEGDAESWLVATPLEEDRRVALKSAPVRDDKREVVISPAESSMSSEVSRSSCLTPASVLEAKPSLRLNSEDSLNNIKVTRPSSSDPGQWRTMSGEHKKRDIRNLPRTIGCINHTPAPALDPTAKPPRSKPPSRVPSSLPTVETSELRNPATKKSLGTKLKGRISTITQKESKKPSSSIPKARSSSIGPIQRNILAVSSLTTRPKSSQGKPKSDAKADDRSLNSKKLSSLRPRPKSSLARPASALGTVNEEGSRGNRLLGLRKKTTSPGPQPRPRSSIGCPTKKKEKAKAVTPSRLASPALQSKSSLGRSQRESISTTKSTLSSRIASPAPRPRSSLGGRSTKIKTATQSAGSSKVASPTQGSLSLIPKTKNVNKDSTGSSRFKRSASSVPPHSALSSRLPKANQENSKVRQTTGPPKRRLQNQCE